MAVRSERRKRLLAKFATVARDRLTRIAELLAQLAEGVDEETVTTLMREIHTLKGESKLMGFSRVNHLAHRSEDLLAWARDRAFEMDAETSDLLTLGLDLMRARVNDPEASDAHPTEGETSFLKALAACLGEESEAAARPDKSEGEEARSGQALDETASHGPARVKVAPGEAPAAARPGGKDPLGPSAVVDDAGPRPSSGSVPAEGVVVEENEPRTRAVLGRKRTRDFVRITHEEVAALTELSADLLSKQAAHREAIATVLRHAREKADREMTALVRYLADASAEIEARLEALQEHVRRLRLHDVQELFERYPPAIRELAREQGKRVKVVVEPTTVAVDRRVLETLDDALLHLVRNSVDHGLELAEDRRNAGKREFGTVHLSAHPRGARVEVIVQDDGRGVDAARVRQAAVRRGKVSAEEAETLAEEEILQLVFEAGLSTRETVTDISGRGVGLDVVKRRVASLGGTVHLATRPGLGTTFSMILPVSATLAEVLLVQAGKALYAIPSTQVEGLLRVAREAVEHTGERIILKVEGDPLPLVSLRELMVGVRVGEPEHWPVSIAVLARGGRRLAVWVDELIGEHRLVQHALGDFLTGVRRVSGTVVAGDRGLAVVVNVPEILEHWGEGRQAMVTQERLEDEGVRVPRVLIVEDSELTRDMLVGLAERIGLEVVEAVNGRDALNRFEADPDLILTDLDMPVMDGFAFVEALRALPEGKEVPVIVLSTRGSDEDKRRAMAAGANAYVIKAEFSETSFRELLSHFVTVPVQR